MFIAIYIAAVFVALLFHRQERKHHYELFLEYQHLGLPLPQSQPKLPRLESLLNVVLGVFLVFGFGAIFLWTNFTRLHEFGADPQLRPQASDWEFTAVVLATGVALVVLGIRSLIQNRRYRELSLPSRTPGTGH